MVLGLSTSRADGKHQSCCALISLLFLNVFYYLVGILYCVFVNMT